MKMSLLKRWWLLVICLIAPYVILVIFHLVFGGSSRQRSSQYAPQAYFETVENVRKNYASEKSEVALNMPSQQDAAKYEKTADVTARSLQFDQHDQAIRDKVSATKGVIQYEKAFGLKGKRELHLVIGITPDKFDQFYHDMQQIGATRSMSVIKEDRTNEYRQLNAQKASLEKTLVSLQELKSKGGQVSDFVVLHDKILEIESRLQDLGVQLGNFNAENEYCTVRFSLYEGTVPQGPGFFTRLIRAIEWSMEYYFYFIVGAFLVSATALLFVLVIDRVKVLLRPPKAE